jgi:beta-N-acetylhexosaminidase
VTLAFAIIRVIAAGALLVFAADWRVPIFVAERAWIFAGLIGGATALAVLELVLWRGLRKQRPLVRFASRLALAAAVFALMTTAVIEARFQWMRYHVMHADPVLVEKLGRHMLVGYRDFAELRELVERRAIGGVFIAPRNIQGRTAAEIKRDIDTLQEIRRRQRLPPLWIAADQEGGIVSRLSPPLASQPRISTIVAAHADAAERRRAARDYATAQGEGLASLGINVNFAPVVDLDFQLKDPNDRYTRISDRAIARDPQVVSEVAEEYCAALAQFDVRCTLKHFPGLGRVVGDTHLDAADLKLSPDELGKSDWLPFRAVMRHANAFTMLSHVHLTALDPDRPVSFSRAVVGGLIRDGWKHDGVLVTDDIGMSAAYRSRDGLAGGSVEALNAGVDLILISYDWSQYFPVMHGLLRAEREGRLQQAALAKSAARLWLTRPGSR